MKEFLYLNSKLCEEFIAQFDGGLYDGEDERKTDGGERSANAGLGIPFADFGGDTSKSHEREVSRRLRQTPESRFNRLETAMRDLPESDFTTITDQSSRVYKNLHPRKVVSADCLLEVPSVGLALSQINGIKGILDLMKSLSPETVDKDSEDAINGMSKLSDSLDSKLVCTGDLGEHNPTLVFKLDQKYLRVDTSDLAGDVCIFGKVQRKWPEGDAFPLVTVPGLDLFDRKSRRSMISQSNDGKNDDMVVQGPGITLSVVAVYR